MKDKSILAISLCSLIFLFFSIFLTTGAQFR